MRERHPAGLLLLLGLLALLVPGETARAWYPNTVQAEDITATWCGYCPYAYAGLEVNKATFDVNEFNAVRYYASSGQFGCALSTARINYYVGSSYPSVYFNGTVLVGGGSAETATGLPYQSVIESLLDDPSYYKLTINSVDFTSPTGSIDLDIEVMEDVPDISNMTLRILVAEDNITYGSDILQDVTRGGIESIAVTVGTLGEIQHVSQPLTIDPTWVTAQLEVLAFIQDDSDRTVYASATNHPTPDYSLRYYALGERSVVGASGLPLPYDYEAFRVYNMGTQTDNYTISVALDGPPDWEVALCDLVGLCFGPTLTTTLAPGEYVDLKVELSPNSSGYGMANVSMTQENYPGGAARTLRYQYITNDLDVLLVDDDGAQAYEDYFTDALDQTGFSYGVWDRNVDVLSAAHLSNFEVVIWNLGWSFPTLDEPDRAALGTYLDNGGALFVTGQDLGWEMDDIGGAALQWYHDYLHAGYVLDNSNDWTLEGIFGDVVSHGIDLTIQGGDGANNQDFPSVVGPYDGAATEIWKYNDTRAAALRVDTGVYRAVYFAFGYEAIDNAADRYLVMQRVLAWLGNDAAIGEEAPVLRDFMSSCPNPVREGATLRFTLPGAEQVRLHVFALDGRLVRTLVSGELAAGTHVIEWDRTDAAGVRLPAGIYLYRLEGVRTALTSKTLLLQ